jgi:predicted nucleotidyltransferase
VSPPDSDFDLVFAALERAGVRYIVVGGVAVVLHGYPRFTADIDLVVALEPANVLLLIKALEALAYRPRPSVQATGLADPQVRQQWIEEKGLVALSFFSPKLAATEIDIFLKEPFPMEAAEARAVRVQLGALSVPIASIPDLIAMKRQSGRAKDLEDIEALEAILRDGRDNE